MSLPPSYQTPKVNKIHRSARKLPQREHKSGLHVSTSAAGQDQPISATGTKKSTTRVKLDKHPGFQSATTKGPQTETIQANQAPKRPVLKKRPRSNPAELHPLVRQWIETVSKQREGHLEQLHVALTERTESHLTALSDISAHHSATRETLSETISSLLPLDLPGTDLIFHNSAGGIKSQTTLGERMAWIAQRVQELRDGTAVLRAEREEVRARIKTSHETLSGLIGGDADEDGHGHADAEGIENARIDRLDLALRVEMDAAVKKAVGAWKNLEDEYRRKRAKHGEHLQRIYRADIEER